MKTETIQPDNKGIGRAAEMLRAGKTVAFATETVYGLGADARNSGAVGAIFAAKQRPGFNPLIVHLANSDMLESIAFLPDIARNLLSLWPGALTLVLPQKPDAGLSDLVTAGLDTVAIRVPAHPVAQALLARFGGPVAAPSANPSGKVSATCVSHVLAGLDGRIDAVLEGGQCAVGVESTIIGFEGEKALLLRPGGIPVETIQNLIGQTLGKPSAGEITAPGQLSSHYAPDVCVRLNAEAPRANEAWLGFGQNPRIAPGLNLSPKADLQEAASHLFTALRKMDALCKREGLSGFAIPPIPQKGLGLAINDRLKRAAAPRHKH